ncbi:hypothetical protein B0181_02925 [Moraxella caviae]|uniref:Glutathionine S-transferase n=1 Tax=Moraxella caviae TaxID=34060 RepID=A0A1T0A6Z4_9GAMM|nr:glutathione S-transferase [Moraxella caviae]OOR91525.1 hypothetical protein B0181_02925 [Moraxella caviae]STZ14389.1 glutathionine S-transferase [Moraxella caviae]VEW10524.1 glutathionine S-transferase [Moraxella caviae]
MLILHHLQKSRSFRILWLLEELKAEYQTQYQLVSYPRSRSYLAPSALADIHPMGKSPTLQVDGRALVESAFIIEYLLRHYDKARVFSPSDTESEWEAHNFWLHHVEGSLMPNLVMRLVFGNIAAKSPFLVRPVAKGIHKKVETLFLQENIKKSLNLLEETLNNHQYITGARFGAADIHAHFALAAMRDNGSLDEQFAAIHNWLKRCESRTAYKSAFAIDQAQFA